MSKIPDEILEKHLGILGINGSGKAFGRADAIVEPSLFDKAYAAGLFDGEGNVTIAMHHTVKTARGPIFNMRIGVSQNDPLPLFWLRDRWGGSVNAMTRKTTKHNITHAWQCFARKAEKFLRDVYPFLQVKAERTNIALAFQGMIFNPGTRGHTPQHRNRMNYLRDLLAVHNSHKSSATFARLNAPRENLDELRTWASQVLT